jgi:uncharacterized NAD(P)/FAD-binding protein YdhS
LAIVMFDPQGAGSGCHDPEQSELNLVNTVAGQLTLFGDASAVGAGPVLGGPSFYEWLRTHSKMDPTGSLAGSAIDADAYYARRLFGRYLQWVFRYLRALAPPHVTVTFVQSAVDHAQRRADGAWLLSADDEQFRVDHLFLTTGHTQPTPTSPDPAVALHRPASRTVVIDDPYPMKSRLAAVTAGMVVAVEGMGLSAMDVVAELTAGRGGRFVTDESAGRTVYLPSGREPRLLLFSRSGIPLGARAVNQKGICGQYSARFLRLSHLRKLRVYRKLDFVQDVLPLLVADMEYAYYEAYLREGQGAAAAEVFCSAFVAADPPGRRRLIDGSVRAADQFLWAALAQPVPDDALHSRDTFATWLVGHLQRDLHEARRGNLDSPLKAACDVLRDLRDALRAAIEFGGLTETSHRWVLSEFMPIMNRLAVGPPASRISELLALMDAGIVTADFGPGARCERVDASGLMCVSATQWPEHCLPVQFLVRARISMHSPGQDASPLLRGLLADGHVRLYHNGGFHPGGIEVDRQHRWVARDGSVVDNAWALGIPTEGVKFCTFVIPRTGVNSTAMVDAGRAVAQMLAMVSRKQGEPPGRLQREMPSQQHALATASQFGAL